jgi:hypothetical protein
LVETGIVLGHQVPSVGIPPENAKAIAGFAVAARGHLTHLLP